MRKLSLTNGEPFSMGKGKNWCVVYPGIGAQQITLNYAIHDIGNEFVQHIHEQSDDIIVVLEGNVFLRQGSRYTTVKEGEAVMIPKGEVHGTVNKGDKVARMVSFQSPPDIALYKGERNKSQNELPIPPMETVSKVIVARMSSGSLDFRKSCDWRRVFSSENGSEKMELWFGFLKSGDSLDLEENHKEGVVIVLSGNVNFSQPKDEIGNLGDLKKESVLFLVKGEKCSITCKEEARIIYCSAL